MFKVSINYIRKTLFLHNFSIIDPYNDCQMLQVAEKITERRKRVSKKFKLLTISLVVMAVVVALVATTVLAAPNSTQFTSNSNGGAYDKQSCCDQSDQTQCNGDCGSCQGAKIGQCQSNNCSGICSGQGATCTGGNCNGYGTSKSGTAANRGTGSRGCCGS